jgi:hypothetical protein
MERMFADFDACTGSDDGRVKCCPPCFSAMLVGREQGMADQSDIAGTVCFIILVSFAVYVTSTNQTAAL